MLNINELLGEELRRNRLLNGFSQEEFAELCMISRAYYGRIERGEHSITIETLIRITKSLGVSMYDLFLNLRV